MKIPQLTLVLLLFSPAVYGQHTISGFIRDQNTGESLIGAAIIDQTSRTGATSNSFGYYSLRVASDSVKIVCSYVGYERKMLLLYLEKDSTINIGLNTASVLNEVVVNATKTEDIQEMSSMSRFTVPVEQIKSLPTLFGERDLIKVLQLLPGVQSGNEGSSGLYVRGGGPDQNLILLDGVPIYNASHLYGFFSTFNSDAINHVELIKGGFPARYGGRLSSVIDISMKEGNTEKIKGRGTIGIISSKAMLEGPIGNKTTFLFSARRSYLNLSKSKLVSGEVDDKYYMYDLNGRINFRINKNNRIFLSAYNGGDQAESSDDFSHDSGDEVFSNETKTNIGWGNTLVALRWNHVYGPRLFSNVTTTYSKYHFNTGSDISTSVMHKTSGEIEEQFYKYDYGSGIEDFAAKIDFDFIPSPRHYMRFGGGGIHHKFSPGILAIASNEEIEETAFVSTVVYATEGFAYFEDDIQVTQRLKLNAGVHAAGFFVEDKNYNTIQPRVSGRYLINPEFSLKASYASMSQFVHLLTNAGIGLPTDLWVPSTSFIKPQNSQQWALGAAGTFNNDYEVSIEGYYKEMNNVIEYKDGASYLSANQNWQNKVEVGKGNSYGAEVFVQKKIGEVSGWIGYTLSWTNRQFDNINGGNWYPYRYDRRHDIKIAGTWRLTKRLELGTAWVFASGNAVTVPFLTYPSRPEDNADFENQFQIPPVQLNYIPSRNNYRMRAYNRLDLSATYTIVRPKVSHEFNLSIYNAYNRKNPFYLKFNFKQENGRGVKYLEQASLIGITPSVSYSIMF